MMLVALLDLRFLRSYCFFGHTAKDESYLIVISPQKAFGSPQSQSTDKLALTRAKVDPLRSMAGT
jgi:hypothetical protein